MNAKKKERKEHFSTYTNSWERCRATKRPCKYGAEAHRVVEEDEYGNRILSGEEKEAFVKTLTEATPETINGLHGKNIGKKMGKAYTKAYGSYKEAKNEYTELSKAVLPELEVEHTDFEDQMNRIDTNKGVLGRLSIKAIPNSKGFKDEAKKASVEDKEKLARASMKTFTAQNEFMEVALKGLNLA